MSLKATLSGTNGGHDTSKFSNVSIAFRSIIQNFVVSVVNRSGVMCGSVEWSSKVF